MTTSDKDAVIWAVCDEFGVEPYELYQRDRHVEACLMRHLAAYVLYTDCGAAYVGIARVWQRNHTTIMNNVAKAKKLIETDSVVAEYLHRIRIRATAHSRVCTETCRAQHSIGNIAPRSEPLLAFADIATLEDRQRRMLYLVADGLEDAAIAREIAEPVDAVRVCVAALKARIGGDADFSRAALVAWYWKGRVAVLEAAPKQTPRYGIKRAA